MNTDIIKQYFDLRKEVFKYFGYEQNYRNIPLDSQLGRYWMICGPEDSDSTTVAFSDKPFTEEMIELGVELYSGTIYTQRFLKKWVYRSEKYTMVAVDTQCDLNQVLMIFENQLECVDGELKSFYKICW